MNIEKVKEIKKALEDNEYYAIEYFPKAGEPKVFGFNDILTLINELESENERLENENYKLEQNLGQCENGYELELHIARCQVHFMEETVEKLKKENEILRNSKVVHETVDYCAEDLQKAQDRIAELEKQMCRNEDLHNATEKLNDIIILKQLEKENSNKTDTITDLLKKQEFYETEKLKQFAERLKKKLEEYRFENEWTKDLGKNEWCLDSSLFHIKVTQDGGVVDETLKEFINE